MDNTNPVISAEQLWSNMGEANLRIVDCRFELTRPDAGRNDYLRGHLPGAVYADLDKDLAAPVASGTGRHPLPDPAELALMFGRLGISTDTKVVVYDDCSGALASRAWWLLRWLGHDRAAVLDGGIMRWQSLQLPVEQGGIVVATQDFIAAPRPELILETTEILAATAESLLLIDARDPARFRGEVEPIDNVAGHIPGALNLPFTESLSSDGTWKSEHELRQLWQEVLARNHETPCGVMCGSGVTACHLVISALRAGLPEPRLYVGSWSEWITDPGRPIDAGGVEKG